MLISPLYNNNNNNNNNDNNNNNNNNNNNKLRFDGITLLDGQIMRESEEEVYKYLGILEVDMMREKEMKKRFVREYKRRLKLVLKSKLNGKNKINAINT